MDVTSQRGIHILKRYPRDSKPDHYMAMDIRKWNKNLPHLPEGQLVVIHFESRGTCDLFLVSPSLGTFLLTTPYYRLVPVKVDKDDEEKNVDYTSLMNGMGRYVCERTKRCLYAISKADLATMGVEMELLSFKAIDMVEDAKDSPYPMTMDDYQQIKINFNRLLEASW